MIGSVLVLRGLTSLVVSVLVVVAPLASRADTVASPEAGPEEALNQKLAVWRFDALGIDPELVARLETLFRMELDRLDQPPIPSPREPHGGGPRATPGINRPEECLARS